MRGGRYDSTGPRFLIPLHTAHAVRAASNAVRRCWGESKEQERGAARLPVFVFEQVLQKGSGGNLRLLRFSALDGKCGLGASGFPGVIESRQEREHNHYPDHIMDAFIYVWN